MFGSYIHLISLGCHSGNCKKYLKFLTSYHIFKHGYEENELKSKEKILFHIGLYRVSHVLIGKNRFLEERLAKKEGSQNYKILKLFNVSF